MLPWVIAVVVLCPLLAAGVTLRRRHTRRARPRAEEFGPIPSCVRLLTSDEDLRDAVERAVAHERVVAQRSTARIDRYHRIVDRPVPIVAGGELLEFEASSGSRPAGRAARGSNAAVHPQPPPDNAA